MKVSEYNQMRIHECNELVPRVFHVYLPVKKLLFDDIETGPKSYAVLFESGHDTYALIVAREGSSQTLGDVRRIVKGMGLEAQRFFPPGADPQYFYQEGVQHFLNAFPGRKQWKKEDIRFYELLADYPVALVRIAAINGEVRRFNQAQNQWQAIFERHFRKIQVR